MIPSQTKTPWVRGKASPNGTYSNSFKSSVTNGGFTIATVYGKSAKECNANAFATTRDILFPASFWYERKARAVLPNSQALVNDLIRQTNIPEGSKYGQPWVNSTQYSTPIFFTDSSTPRVPVWLVDKEGKPQSSLELFKIFQLGIPMPSNFKPAVGNDAHTVVIDIENGPQWETYALRFINNRWECRWGGYHPNILTFKGYFDIANGNEPWGGSATSISLAGGTIRLLDLMRGYIPHVIRFAIPDPSKIFIPPALRTDGFVGNNNGIIPYGQIFKIKASYVTPSTASPFERIRNKALQEFGMILTDRCVGGLIYYVEDYTPYGLVNALEPFFGGKPKENNYRSIPLSQMEAVQWNG